MVLGQLKHDEAQVTPDLLSPFKAIIIYTISLGEKT